MTGVSPWRPASVDDGRLRRSEEPAATQPLTVLVAEGAEDDLERLVVALAQAGFEVRAARSSVELFEHLSAESPILVVLDVDLPPGSGVETCRGIRERSDALILAVSARKPPSDLVAVIDVGADSGFDRVDRPRELIARVRALLRRHGIVAPEGPTSATPIAGRAWSHRAETRW